MNRTNEAAFETVIEPINPDFPPIVLSGADEGKVQVIAEVVEVLGTPA